LEPAHELKRGVDVVSVEDRLVDLLEPHRLETGELEHLRGGLGVAERERVRGWLQRSLHGRAEGGVDRQCPFVELAALSRLAPAVEGAALRIAHEAEVRTPPGV